MKAIKDKKKTMFDFEQKIHIEDQRKEDRRQEANEGFCYISTAGWICRRERNRRKNVDRPQKKELNHQATS
jgi:hypothetical protein